MDKICEYNAEHYIWGDNCDGWHLLKNDNLSVIKEIVPPGKSEKKHFHKNSHQFFFILDGEGAIELENEIIVLKKNDGLEIPPGKLHKFLNNSDSNVEFLVISSPKSNGDRVNIE